MAQKGDYRNEVARALSLSQEGFIRGKFQETRKGVHSVETSTRSCDRLTQTKDCERGRSKWAKANGGRGSSLLTSTEMEDRTFLTESGALLVRTVYYYDTQTTLSADQDCRKEFVVLCVLFRRHACSCERDGC